MIKPRCGRNDCRYSIDNQVQTLVASGSVDVNAVTGRMSCESCKKKWLFVQSYQGTTFNEIKTESANELY